ncbi:transcription antitermination factor NusB [Aestuariispira insulae]|uniref:Transcription antitermination protein NusB n=1 Tax=Aestuariispira insulae TaxID=1461337 RepID=A0A3D9HV55_9PROT|nr:transcription antitermination factor NusB [Aestuariispira insulae]RED53372.1 NusB antitermination factor [Aestuariispira insulae]
MSSKGKRRRAARLAAVQALYDMSLTDHSVNAVVAEFAKRGATAELEGQEIAADSALFTDIVRGVVERQDDLDAMINSAMTGERNINNMEILMRCILRAGAYELVARGDIDPPLTISEYLTVVTSFFGGGEGGFVNGVLDRLAKTLRSDNLED